MTKIMDTPYVHYELKDDLLIATYKKNLKLNLEIVKEIVRSRLELIGNKPTLVLILNQGVTSMDKKARDYLSSPEGVSGIIASAIVLDSAFGSFLGNFFVAVTKPKIPVRIFSSRPEALKWLQKYTITSDNG